MGDGSGDDIMDRLEAILDGLTDFRTRVRDEVEIGFGQPLPSCTLQEGGEDIEGELKRNHELASVPMKMFPVIWIAHQAPAREIGRELRRLRRVVIKAILNDAPLKALIGRPGGIIYRGFVPDTVKAEQILGRLALRFEIETLFAPAQF